MKYIVDRFEGEYVLLEEYNKNSIKKVLKNNLPGNITEGDILEYNNGIYTILKSETIARKECIKERFSRLIKN